MHPSAPVTDPEERRGLRVRVLALESLVVSAITMVFLFWHLQLWRARWREPWEFAGDASFYLMLIQSLGRHGTYLTNPHLGWPFGQQIYDLPQGVDNFHLGLLKIIYRLTNGPGATINVFYVLTFVMVAAMAHVVFRHLGMRRLVAGAGALLFTFFPYHWFRNEGHLLLSGYELVPLGVLLALQVMGETPPLTKRDLSGRLRLDIRSRRSLLVIAACAGLASTGAYYFVFSFALMLLGGVLVSIGSGSWRPVVSALAMSVIGGAVFAVNISPTLIYSFQHGSNTQVAARTPVETELYGLRINLLFLPREGHRIARLAEAGGHVQEADGRGTKSETGQQLGIVGAVGLAALLALMLVAVVARDAVAQRLRGPTMRQMVRLSLLTVICLLIGVISGFSFFISAVLLPEIRAYNRISIVIGFMALTAVCLMMDRGITALAAWRPKLRPAAAAIVVVPVFLIGMFDQTGRDKPLYAPIHERYVSDKTFFDQVTTRLGAGAKIFTLPHIAFPESGTRAQMGSYDQAMGYVYAPSLYFSWGFMMGRAPEYPYALQKLPAEEWLTDVAAIGFDGIVVFRPGFVDVVSEVDALVNPVIGPPELISADFRYMLYDLRPFRDKVRARLGDAGVATLRAEVLATAGTP